MLAGITNRILTYHEADLLEIIRERYGAYRLASSRYTSRYEWTKQTEQVVRNIEAALSEDFPTLAIRPLFYALNCTHFEKTFGL